MERMLEVIARAMAADAQDGLFQGPWKESSLGSWRLAMAPDDEMTTTFRDALQYG
jgi:hypothetical protein